MKCISNKLFFLFVLIIGKQASHAMEKNISSNQKKSKLTSIHLLLNTLDEGNGNEVYDTDGNKAVLFDLVRLLVEKSKKPSDTIYISYGLCTSFQEGYRKACSFFSDLGIKDPLEQVVIQPKTKGWCGSSQATPVRLEEELLPFLQTKKHAKGSYSISLQRIAYFKHPEEVFEQDGILIAQNNCKKYVLGTENAYYDIFLENFGFIVAANQGWQWIDTKQGLYGLTKKNSSHEPLIDLNTELTVDPLREAPKKDTNQWLDSLQTFFTVPKGVRASVHLYGHGSAQEEKIHAIVGLTEEQIQSMCTFFNNSSQIDLLTIESCHCDGAKILDVIKKYNGVDFDSLNFSIISAVKNKELLAYSGILRLLSYKPGWFHGKDSNDFAVKPEPSLDHLSRKLHKRILADTDKGVLTKRFLEKRWQSDNNKPSLLLAGTTKQIVIN